MTEVGKPLVRVDARLKVTGAASYAAEFRLPKLAHAALVTSTIAQGTVRRYETWRARITPGVLGILTPRNAMRLAIDPLASEDDDRLHLLQDHRVHFNGQPVAVVIAESLEAALHAASLVRVHYQALPARIGFEAHLSHAREPRGSAEGGSTRELRGSVKAGFAQEEVSIDAVYTTPFEHHQPMEPHATLAAWDGPHRLNLWDSTQAIINARNRVAALLGLERAAVTLLSPFVGGGFGCKGNTWAHVVLAAMAARHVQRPVKLVLRRVDMASNVGFRPKTLQRVRLAAKRDGRLTAITHASTNPCSLFQEFVEPTAFTTRILYACPNLEISHHIVPLAMGAPSVMRGPGVSAGLFALESAMDELAVALEMDPLALRLRNDAKHDPMTGKPYSSKSLDACYRVGAERAGWKHRELRRGCPDGSGLIGLGMATATHPVYCDRASAKAVLRADGMVTVSSSASDLGTGTYTVMAQVAADELGVSSSQVRFQLGDSRMPEAPAAWGSQQSASVGGAVQLVAARLRARAIALATSDPGSPLWQARAEDVAVEEGRMFLRTTPAKGESYGAMLTRLGRGELEVSATSELSPNEADFAKHAFGAVFAEVKVDLELGTVRVLKLTGAYAAGRILNARTARSQILGGMTMGLGMALMEESVADTRTGRFVTRDLADYHVPVHADIPAMDVAFIPEKDTIASRVGSKGIGEISVTGTAAAIANAVFHATGVRIRDLPITPDKLVRV